LICVGIISQKSFHSSCPLHYLRFWNRKSRLKRFGSALAANSRSMRLPTDQQTV
jgi:hypothetical protein